jgi:signal transduction histidine kinase
MPLHLRGPHAAPHADPLLSPSLSPLSQVAGSMYILVSVFVYVSAIPGRVAHQEQLKMKDAALSAKNTFLSYISHEMRTPLNSSFLGLQVPPI